MDAHSVNSSRKIVWVGNNPNNSSDTHNIVKVVYYDNYNAQHVIWPCDAELTNIYLVRITREATNSYTNWKSYDEVVQYQNVNGTPNVSMLPYNADYASDPSKHNVYALKGDVKVYEVVNGTRTGNYTTLEDCYFFSETRQTKAGTDNNVRILGNTVTTYGARPSKLNNVDQDLDWKGYVTFTVSDEPGESQWIQPQCGYMSGNSGYVQLNYIFDPNYSTPIWLKRATVTQNIVITTTSSNNVNNGTIFTSGSQMQVGDSVTVWAKFHRTAEDQAWTNPYYERYLGVNEVENSDVSITYNNSYFSIVDNNNGSYTISVIGGSSDMNLKSIIFTDSVSGSTGTINIIPLPAKAYNVWRNGASFAAGTASIPTGNSTTIKFMECSNYMDQNPTWVEYTGSNCSLTANSSGVITVTQNQNRPYEFTVAGIAEGTRTLTPTIEGQTLSTLTINVNAPTSVSFTLPNNITSTLDSTYPYQTSWNFTTGQVSNYTISFSSNIYVDTGDPTVGNGKIYVSMSGSTGVVLSIMSGNQPTSGSVYNLDVYTSQGGTFLGTIAITLYH